MIFAVKLTIGSVEVDSTNSEYPTTPVKEVLISCDKRSMSSA
jgi:hypothetical protein